jgi:hypothetical protein
MVQPDKAKCLDRMDLSCDWHTWRTDLKANIVGDRKYYWQDEAVQHVAERLDALLDEKINPDKQQEELVKEMWDVASVDERKSLAMVLLKLAEKS